MLKLVWIRSPSRPCRSPPLQTSNPSKSAQRCYATFMDLHEPRQHRLPAGTPRMPGAPGAGLARKALDFLYATLFLPTLSGQQRLRVFLGDDQEFQRCLLRFPRALFPASDRIVAHIEVLCEQSPSGLEVPANPPDFMGGDLLGRGRNNGHSQVRSFTLPVFLNFFQCLFQLVEDVDPLPGHILFSYVVIVAQARLAPCYVLA